MNPKTRMSSGGSRFGGHRAPTGHEQTQAFGRALRTVYDTARGLSNDEPRYVKNPRTRATVGVIRRSAGVPCFTRNVKESVHRLRMFGGSWALERDLVAELERLGARWVCLVTDAGRRLYAPLNRFRESGRAIKLGHGLQFALAEDQFTSFIDDSEEDDPHSPEPAPVSPVQPSLFGGAAHASSHA